MVNYTYVTYIHVESGRVENLMAVIMRDGSSFTITITWSAPIEPNGVITHYIYTVNDVSNMVLVSDNTSETSVMDLNVMGIQPHTNYNVSVFAVNSAGNGESNQISVRSPETGKGLVYLSANAFIFFFCVQNLAQLVIWRLLLTPLTLTSTPPLE